MGVTNNYYFDKIIEEIILSCVIIQSFLYLFVKNITKFREVRRMTPYFIIILTVVSYLLNRLAALVLFKIIKNTGTSTMSGDDIARRILEINQVKGVKIKEMENTGEDLYDPILRVIQLGRNVYGCKTIYSLAVGCHEACHAIDFQYLRFFSIPVSLMTKFVFIPLFLLSLFFHSWILQGVILVIYVILFLFRLFVEVLDEVHINKFALKALIQMQTVRDEEIIETKRYFRYFNITYITSLPLKIFIYS